MKATIKTVGEYGNGGVFRLKMDTKDYYDFGCNDCNDIIQFNTAVGEARRKLHNMLDVAIDTAASDFLKHRFKNID